VTMGAQVTDAHAGVGKGLGSVRQRLYALDDTTLDALMRRTPSLKKHPKGAMETLGADWAARWT